MLIFLYLFRIWQRESEEPLSGYEKMFLAYLRFMMIMIVSYYTLCIFSTAEWVKDHNFQMGSFLVATIAYYKVTYKNAFK